jgi:hypothetical protein
MRKFSQVTPSFWTGKTGRELRQEEPLTSLIALYLITSPGSNMIGLYYLPIGTIAHDIGCGFEGASKGLQRLSQLDFSSYDDETEFIFVHEMAKYQIGESIKPDDRKHKWVIDEWLKCCNYSLLCKFFDRYGEPFRIPRERLESRGIEGASKGHRRGITRGIEGAHTRDGDGDGDGNGEETTRSCTEPEKAPASAPSGCEQLSLLEELTKAEEPPPQKAPSSPASPEVFRLPCLGPETSRAITQDEVDSWREAYPGVDVMAELRKMKVWLEANRAKRKTHRGIPAFAVKWLGKAQDSPKKYAPVSQYRTVTEQELENERRSRMQQ